MEIYMTSFFAVVKDINFQTKKPALQIVLKIRIWKISPNEFQGNHK